MQEEEVEAYSWIELESLFSIVLHFLVIITFRF